MLDLWRFRLSCTVIAAMLTVTVSAEEIIRLLNAESELEIAPRLGGRITSFRLHGRENILFSTVVGDRENVVSDLRYDGNFKQYYGHVMWLGPQSAWWRQQDAEPAPKAKGLDWPPDPYWEFSRFAVTSRTADRVVLTSGHSPFSGVAMTKEIKLSRNEVELKTTVVNTGTRSVKWGLWSNTRVRPDAVVSVPADLRQPLKYEFKAWNIPNERMMTYEITDGYFVFRAPGRGVGDGRVFRGKTFLIPAEPVIAVRARGELFVKSTVPVPPARVAPGHYPVEIYAEIGGREYESFFELEFHGEYRELAPGETLAFLERWALYPEEPDRAKIGIATPENPSRE